MTAMKTYPENPLIPLRRFVLTESLQTFHQQTDRDSTDSYYILTDVHYILIDF